MSDSITASLKEWLSDKDWTLALSAGFFGFYAHCGVISALEEANLRPSRIHGCSAGALVAAFWASGMQIGDITSNLLDLRKEDFWDPAPGAGLLRGQRFAKLLQERLPVQLFSECRIPLHISVYDMLTLRTRILSQGKLEPAIRASCAVPLLFQPVAIGKRPALDGGVFDRSATHGIPADMPVLCHYLIPHEKSPGQLKDIPDTHDNRIHVGISALPKCGPDRLAFGIAAYQRAYQAMRRALTLPIASRMLVS